MRVWMWPRSSSASRIAPMRPSIMSDGATTSTRPRLAHSAWSTRHLDRFVVDDVAVLVEHAVLTVARVRVERDVGQDAQFGEVLLQFAHGARDQSVRRSSPHGRRASSARVRSTGNSASTGMPSSTHSSATPISRSTDSAFDARHRRHGLPHVHAFDDENRIDQIVRGEDVFAHQAAREVVAAHAARTVMRIETHGLFDVGSDSVDGRRWCSECPEPCWLCLAGPPRNFSRQWYIIPIELGALR